MTRANLIHALEILNGGEHSSGSKRDAIEAITAALAQPKPSPVACMWTEHSGIAGSPLIRYADVPPGYITDAVLLYAAPPAPDADPTLPNSTELEQLRRELADMTAQRDSWIALMDIARAVYDTTAAKALADMDADGLAEDRLDAQRWRTHMALLAMDEPFPESFYETFSVAAFTAAIDAETKEQS